METLLLSSLKDVLLPLVCNTLKVVHKFTFILLRGRLTRTNGLESLLQANLELRVFRKKIFLIFYFFMG